VAASHAFYYCDMMFLFFQVIAREHDFNEMLDQLVAELGSRTSKWEVLWDEDSQQEVSAEPRIGMLVVGVPRRNECSWS
jgi:hypothetical protein